MQDAVAWVKANNPNHEHVFYNDSRMRYYAGEKFDKEINQALAKNSYLFLENLILNKKIYEYEFLLIKTNQKQKSIINIPKYILVAEFSYAGQNKFIRIYKKN